MMTHHTLFFPIKLPFECQSIGPLTIQFVRKLLGVYCLLRLQASFSSLLLVLDLASVDQFAARNGVRALPPGAQGRARTPLRAADGSKSFSIRIASPGFTPFT